VVLAVPNLAAFLAGSRINAARWKSDVTDAVTFLANPPVFQAYQSAAQSISNSSVTALGMDTEVVDTYNGHDTVTNNSRWTCPTGAAGTYVAIGYFGLAANATGVRLVRINKNGATLPLSQSDLATPGTAVSLATFSIALVQLAVGEYVEAYGFQTSGGALNTTPTDTGMALFWLHA